MIDFMTVFLKFYVVLRLSPFGPLFILQGAVKKAWIITNFNEIIINTFQKSFPGFSLSNVIHRNSSVNCDAFQNQLWRRKNNYWIWMITESKVLFKLRVTRYWLSVQYKQLARCTQFCSAGPQTQQWTMVLFTAQNLH